MLSDIDLKRIGGLLDSKVVERLIAFEARMDSKFDKRLIDFETSMDSKFDKRFGDFENKIDSKFDEKFDKGFGDFAILMQKEFSGIHKRLDYLDNTKADKSDIARLEGYIMRSDRRVERLEDDMRVVKSKLELA